MKTLTVLALLGTAVLSGCASSMREGGANSQLVDFSLSGENILMSADVRVGEKVKSEVVCNLSDFQVNAPSISFSPMYEAYEGDAVFAAQTSWILSSDLGEDEKGCVAKAMYDGLKKSNADFVIAPRYLVEKVKKKKEKNQSFYSSDEVLKATVKFYPGYYTNIRKAVVVTKPESKNNEPCVASNCKMMLPVIPVAGVECKTVNEKGSCK